MLMISIAVVTRSHDHAFAFRIELTPLPNPQSSKWVKEGTNWSATLLGGMIQTLQAVIVIIFEPEV